MHTPFDEEWFASLLATQAGTPSSLPTVRRGGAMLLVFRGSYSGRTPNVKLRCAARRVDRAGVLGQVSAPRTGARPPTPSASPDSDDDEMARRSRATGVGRGTDRHPAHD